VKPSLNQALKVVGAFSLLLTPPILAQASQVGYWGFEEAGGSTTIIDSSGAGNNGILVNGDASTRVTGKVGNALLFNGTTGAGSTRVVIPDSSSLDLSTAGSFAAWVKPDDLNRDAPIVAKEGNGNLTYWSGVFFGKFGVLLDRDGNQPWESGTTAARSFGMVTTAWTFLASTWDGTNIRHYQDGVFVGQHAFSGPLFNSSESLAIGVNSGYNFTAFKGIIDEVRIYNNALTEGEIEAIFLNTTPVPEPRTYALILAGLGLLAFAAHRRNKRGARTQ
jgi:hypothetical protein